MITFGLTGGIACGKSTVNKTFQARGIPMIDADIVARQVVELGTSGLQMITDAFGREYLNEDGTLNRTKLAKLVFADRQSRSKLDYIMLPLINEESSAQIRRAHSRGHSIVGYDAALICEMGNSEKYRPLIVVHCPEVAQIDRLIRRNNLTHEEAVLRISAQMPVIKKLAMADYSIDTSGSIEESVRQTEVVIQHFIAINKQSH
jgi:dephospho-CoA kinase